MVLYARLWKEIAMRLLVCGDRNWKDYDLLLQEVTTLHPDIVIEGEARGADLMARTAAYSLGIEVIAFSAQWDKYGRAAGPIRNQQMLTEGRPDMVLAFHDSITSSKGTANMIRIAKLAGVPVKLVSHPK